MKSVLAGLNTTKALRCVEKLNCVREEELLSVLWNHIRTAECYVKSIFIVPEEQCEISEASSALNTAVTCAYHVVDLIFFTM